MNNNIGNIFGNIKERILQIGDFYHIGRKNICEKIGMTYGNFTGKAKDTPINSIAIQNIIVNFPKVSITWLLTGKGEMLIEDSVQQSINEDVEQLKRLIKVQEMAITLQKENAELKTILKAENEKLIAEICSLKEQIRDLKAELNTPESTTLKREPKFE